MISWFPHRRKSLKGGIEGVARGVVFGWAVDTRQPEPVELEVVIGGTVVGKARADLPRPDIALASKTGGRCGFTCDLRSLITDSRSVLITIRAIATGRVLSGSPFEITQQSGWGVVDAVHGLVVNGWAVIGHPSQEHAAVEILVDGHLVGTTMADLDRPDLRLAGVPQSRCGFKFTLPSRFYDDQKHGITGRIAGTDQALRGGEKEFRAAITSHIDHVSLERVSGWVVNLRAPDRPLELDVYLNDEFLRTIESSTPRADVAKILEIRGQSNIFGFDVRLPVPEQKWRTRRLRICFAGTQDTITEDEHIVFRNAFVVEVLENIVASLFERREMRKAVEAEEYKADIREYLMPYLIAQFRQKVDWSHVAVITGKGNSLVRQAATSAKDQLIDIVVPVYKGYRETLDCLDSVLKGRASTECEIIVINDHSPDPELTAALRQLAKEGRYTLLENEQNRGFVSSVNRGMRLHPWRDVVLLNSDTIVPKGWLEGMHRAAHSAPGIATVTPFSNRATICSIPRTCYDNQMPLGLSVEELNRICSAVNPGVVVDIPTAIGFAMYIRRQALNEVGYFDEEKWGKGYGEENEFCIRASDRGWRHVAACDVFVQHHGSVSFDTEKSPRVKANLAKLNELYPDYPGKVQRFIQADPLAEPRGRINAELMKRIDAKYIVFVTHGLGGGTEKAIRDLCAGHAQQGLSALIVRSTPTGKIELAPAIPGHETTLVTEYPRETSAETIAASLRGLSIEAVQFHHTLGFQSDMWKLPGLLNVPYEVMIHDFYFVCPRLNLIDDTGVYCGQPNLEACERCAAADTFDHDIDKRLAEVGGSIAKWRVFHGTQLAGARSVLAPSEDTKKRVNVYLPTQAIQVRPHSEPEFVFQQRQWDGTLPYRVAVLGAIGSHKGVNLLRACAKYAERRGLPIKFVVIGYTSCDEAFAKFENVEITGPYKQDELERVVRTSRCTVALFLSVWPETFSYTLSEAWRLGLYPVALDIGAQADRIREKGCGTVLPFTQEAQTIITQLLRVLDEQQSRDGEAIASALRAHDEDYQ